MTSIDSYHLILWQLLDTSLVRISISYPRLCPLDGVKTTNGGSHAHADKFWFFFLDLFQSKCCSKIDSIQYVRRQ